MILCRDNNQHLFRNKDYTKELHMPHKVYDMPLSQENLNFHSEKPRGKIKWRTPIN